MILIIWVDADACPVAVKNILYRAANRTKTRVVLVSNQILQIPNSLLIQKIRVTAGFDVADNEIVKNLQSGDIVVTADLPLADAAISKGAIALNPRGTLYTEENIKNYLSYRNFGEQLRSSGVTTKGPAKLSAGDIQKFANCLDRLLSKLTSH